MNGKPTIFTVLFLFNTLFSFAQKPELVFKNYTDDSGLPTANIHCLVQDNYGFIWAGSYNGLVKFNGIDFTTYFHEFGNKQSLKGNVIFDIKKDKLGNLWVATNEGLSFYDSKHDGFRDVKINHANYSVIKSIDVDHNDDIWIISANEVYLLDKSDSVFYNYLDKFTVNKPELSGLISIKFDTKNNLWLGSEAAGLLKINIASQEYKRYFEKDNLLSSELNSINAIFEDSKGNVWVGHNGLKGYNWVSDTFYTYSHNSNEPNSLGSNKIFCIYEDSKGGIWLGALGGIDYFDVKTGKFQHFKSNAYAKGALPSNSVYVIMEDVQGNLWVGTGLSLSVAQLHNHKGFKVLKHNPDDSNSLISNSVTSFHEDKEGLLWMGTYGGLSCYNRDLNSFKNFEHNTVDPFSLPVNSIQALEMDNKGRIWLGGYGSGLSYYDKTNGKFYQFPFQANNTKSISHDDIRSILYDTKGNLWVATNGGGLNLFNEKEGTFKYYKKSETQNSLVSDYCLSLYEDNNGIIYIGTYHGLSIFNPANEQFENIIDELSNKWVYCLYKDAKDNLWIGTAEGLNCLNLKTRSIKSYFKKDGLPNDAITGMCEDNMGNLWISTNGGISKFNTNDLIFHNYDELDGIQGNSHMHGAFYKNSEGLIYFGGNQGVTIINTEKITDNAFIPPVIITNLLIGYEDITKENSKLLNTAVYEAKKLILSYKQTPITFKYVALNYVNSKKNSYAYKLDGFDDWNYAKERREATYTNLPAGNYTFIVKASNDDGVWNNNGTSIQIKITPPFWKTWWFQTLLIISIVVIIVLVFSLRVNMLRKQKKLLKLKVIERTKEINHKNEMLKEQSQKLSFKNKLLEENQQYILEQTEELKVTNEKLVELNDMKNELFSIIGHDLKNPLGVILGMSEILSLRFNDLNEEKKQIFAENIHQSAQKLFLLLQNLLNWARSQSGKMVYKQEKIRLKSIAEENRLLLKELVMSKNITFSTHINDELSAFADYNMLDTVLRNLLSNAIKYTPNNGRIQVSANMENATHIKISIIDNGIGIPEQTIANLFRLDKSISTPGTNGEKGTGLGLMLCKEFVEKNGGTIWVESKKGEGSQFHFTIPGYKD